MTVLANASENDHLPDRDAVIHVSAPFTDDTLEDGNKENDHLPDVDGITEVSPPFTGDTSDDSNKVNEQCQVSDKVVLFENI